MSEDRQERFVAYVEALAEVIGHADRAAPLRDYCLGLLLPGERKSVEPMAAVTAPARVSAKHQSLLHFVANAPWSDERVLSRIQELSVPIIEDSGAIEAWIVDDTGFPKKVVIRSGWRASIAASLVSGTIARSLLAYRWPIMRRACRSPGACICRWNGRPTPSAAPPPASPRRSGFSPSRRSRWSRSKRRARPVCRAGLC